MSFASDVKEEIGKQYDKGRHCQIAQLAVIFALTGHIKRDFKNDRHLKNLFFDCLLMQRNLICY